MGLSDSEPSDGSEEFLDDSQQSEQLKETVAPEYEAESHMAYINEQPEIFTKDVFRKLRAISKLYYKFKKDSMALNKIATVLIERKISQLYKRIWDAFHEKMGGETYSKRNSVAVDIFSLIKVIWVNFSDKCRVMGKEAYETNLIEYCLKDLMDPELAVDMLKKHKRRYVMKLMLGILHNCVRHFPENKHHIRKGNGLELLMNYYSSTFLIIKAKVIIILAYCVTDEENDTILVGSGVISFIVNILSSAIKEKNHVAKQYHFSALETVQAIDKLASNDNNKKTLVGAGVLPLLVTMLDVEKFNKLEVDAVVNCIWTLSFNQDNAAEMRYDVDLLGKIKSISKTTQNIHTKKACHGISFVLESIETNEVVVPRKGAVKNKQIMLSYQWSFQPTILKIRDELTSKGYDVWVDVDKMKGNILGGMADAVETSAIIVLAMSESYKNSNSCRTEAEYAYKLGKPVIYLLLQSGYMPDGWLGALLGMNLYLDFSIPDNESEVLPQLERDILEVIEPSSSSRKLQQQRPVTAATTTTRKSNKTVTNPEVERWTCEETQTWFKSLNLGDSEFFEECDGEMLIQIMRMKDAAFQCYLQSMEHDVKLNFKQRLKFTAALEKL